MSLHGSLSPLLADSPLAGAPCESPEPFRGVIRRCARSSASTSLQICGIDQPTFIAIKTEAVISPPRVLIKTTTTKPAGVPAHQNSCPR